MLGRAPLPRHDSAADIAPDIELGRIGIIMAGAQRSAQLDGGEQHRLVRAVEDLGVELRRGVAVGVPRGVRGGQGNGVVVDAGVDEDAAGGLALVEAVHAQGLHVNGADFDAEVLAEDVELDGPAPGVFRLDPDAVVVGLLVEDHRGVFLRLRLDRLRDDGAEFRHVVHRAEEGAVERAEETRVVVGHYPQEEGGRVGWKGDLGRVLVSDGGLSGEGERLAAWLADRL